ncbi:hypothetical protein Rsub_01209 [Raphidocelis subcapitata]|uniref:AB hydrolase-1 domain-containing protein n=1 Tax=Raphidocelis subcapitata TaxID=307507 RepID=A0A2V0NM16_9CHLO|nr:hypothetical protein Rsub_01209 [Raphidocelis subcapitata]|eukprot:GBF88496.1 hypothetical protein Rsub_01209 [Raphidocelis subcapitata]
MQAARRTTTASARAGPARSARRALRVRCSAAALEEKQIAPGVFEGYWRWNGHKIRYQRSGDSGPAVLLVHGFGGNCDHWRKNTPVLGQSHRAYSIDLLGYGYSDKPDPRVAPSNSIYCFETWGQQLSDFIDQKIGEQTALIANSVGGLAAMQAALLSPQSVSGVQLINISLRGLHVSRQAPLARPFIAAFQRLLRETELGRAFFGNVAQPKAVKNVLRQCYARKEAVTDELVDYILKPGLEPGAVDVFLDFISYSGGPLPEELLARMTAPVSILWGADDPWESCSQGRALFTPLPAVEEFVEMPGLGHCPQDEAPEVVNPKIVDFVARCARRAATSSGSDGDGAAVPAAAAAAEH